MKQHGFSSIQVDSYKKIRIFHHFEILLQNKLSFDLGPKLYTPSTLNNSNETHTFMCLGRVGRFGQH